MSLDKEVLLSELETLFNAPPPSFEECAAAWGTAVGTYAKDVTPAVAEAVVDTASGVLTGALTTAFQGASAAEVANAMEAAFLTFATSLATGMAASGYVGTPPPSIVGFLSIFSNPDLPETTGEAAERFADAIHLWFQTGTATLGATVTNWS